MGNKWRAWLPVGILTSSLLIWSAGLGALTFNVVVKSTDLNGVDAVLDFLFLSPESPTNTVALSTLTSNGTLGPATIIGDVTDTGVVGSSQWIFSDFSDTSLQNELQVDFKFNVLPTGTSLSFSFTPVTDNPPFGTQPDSFSFYVLDPNLAPLITTSDPTGADALFLFSFGQSEQTSCENGLFVDGLCVYTPDQEGFSIEVTPSQGAPEPGTLALLAAGFGALLRRRRFM